MNMRTLHDIYWSIKSFIFWDLKRFALATYILLIGLDGAHMISPLCGEPTHYLEIVKFDKVSTKGEGRWAGTKQVRWGFTGGEKQCEGLDHSKLDKQINFYLLWIHIPAAICFVLSGFFIFRLILFWISPLWAYQAIAVMLAACYLFITLFLVWKALKEELLDLCQDFCGANLPSPPRLR